MMAALVVMIYYLCSSSEIYIVWYDSTVLFWLFDNGVVFDVVMLFCDIFCPMDLLKYDKMPFLISGTNKPKRALVALFFLCIFL